jgi:hypothetical protein
VKLKGRPVLMVAEVEQGDGASIQHTYEHYSAVTPSGTITRAVRHDDITFSAAADYRTIQSAEIPVLHRHDPRRKVGEVVYLKWIHPDTRIVCVCEVDGDEAVEWVTRHDSGFISPGTKCTPRGAHRLDVEIDHLGLVESTARLAARPVAWVPTSFEERSKWAYPMAHYGLLREAAEARRKRRGMGEMPIVGHPHIVQEDERPPLFRTAVRPIRTATSPFDDRVGAAVRRGVNPYEAMWAAAGHSGAALWDGPNGITYGIC